MTRANQMGQAQLVAVMVAAGISGAVILTQAELFTSMTKINRQAVQAESTMSVRNGVEELLVFRDACTLNFGVTPSRPAGMLADATLNLSNILNKDGTAMYEVGATYEGGTIRFVSWFVKDSEIIIKPGVSPYVTEADKAVRVVDLNLNFVRVAQAAGEQFQMARTVKLLATKVTTPASAIENCYALAGAGQELWARDASGDSIYNTNLGNVGINTMSPSAKLDVVGNMRTNAELRSQSIDNLGVFNIGGNLTATHIGVGTLTSSAGNALDVLGSSRVQGAADTLNLNTQNFATTTNALVDQNLDEQALSTFGSLRVVGSSVVSQTSGFQSTGIFASNVNVPNSNARANGYSGTAAFGTNSSFSTSGSMSAERFIANQFCIGPNCRTTFAAQGPISHRVARRLNSSGTLDWSDPNCPANALFMGLNAGGSPNCMALPNLTCTAPGQYIETVNPTSGAVTCGSIPANMQVNTCTLIGPRQLLTSFSVGMNRTCSNPFLPVTIACTGTQVARTIASTGNVSCVEPTAGGNCPAGVAVGFDQNGQAICGPPYNAAACGAGTVPTGIQGNGQFICNPIVISGGSCPAGTAMTAVSTAGVPECGCAPKEFTWYSVGPNHNPCRAVMGASKPGWNQTATDDFSMGDTFTGSLTFNCSGTTYNEGSPVSSYCSAQCPAYSSEKASSSNAFVGPHGCQCDDGAAVNIGEQCAVHGACGGANGGTWANAGAAIGQGLCARGNPSSYPSGAGPWSWTCSGFNGGSPSGICSASQAPPTGACHCEVRGRGPNCGGASSGIISDSDYTETAAACGARNACLPGDGTYDSYQQSCTFTP